jgi:hypothetical protein
MLTNKQTMKYTVSITKDEFEALDDTAKATYTLDGDEATASFDGAPGQAEIDKAVKKKGIAEEHKKKAEDKLKIQEDLSTKLQSDLDSAGGNKAEIEKVRLDYAEKVKALDVERAAEIVENRKISDNAMIREYAEKFANERFTVPDLIADKIASRIAVEDVNGVPVLRPRNADGTPSVGTLEDVQKEFLEVPAYKGIIKANVGDGGGASQSNGGGATNQKLSEMDADAQVAFKMENPEQFAAMSNA